MMKRARGVDTATGGLGGACDDFGPAEGLFDPFAVSEGQGVKGAARGTIGCGAIVFGHRDDLRDGRRSPARSGRSGFC